MDKIERNYDIARECFAEYGVDTDAVLRQMEKIPISVHCWQIDDLTGFEDFQAKLTGGIAATGNMGGKPKSQTEYFRQLDKALKLIPGKLKVAAHAVYLDFVQRGSVYSGILDRTWKKMQENRRIFWKRDGNVVYYQSLDP